MTNLFHLLLVVLIFMGYNLSDLTPPTYHYPFFFLSLVLWPYGDIVVGCCITSTSLSVYTKVWCDFINEVLL